MSKRTRPPIKVKDSTNKALIISSVILISSILIIFFAGLSPNVRSAGQNSVEITRADDPHLPNYDIRNDKSAAETLNAFRRSIDAAAVQSVKNAISRGSEKLRIEIKDLRLEINPEMGTPEVISADTAYSNTPLLARRGNNAETLRSFINENTDLFGLSNGSTDELKLVKNYVNPDGKLAFAEFEQHIDSIPVFRGTIKGGFMPDGTMFRVINNLAPLSPDVAISKDFGDGRSAANAAMKFAASDDELSSSEPIAHENKLYFGDSERSPSIEKVYFPTEPGVVVPAWLALIWKPVNAFYVVVDAQDQKLLWRKNITNDQTQASVYEVYDARTSMVQIADSPAPFSPGPADPTLGTQAPIVPRAPVTLVGNEAPYNFNSSGWLNDGANTTDGNAVEAGLDLVSPDGIDAGTQAVGSPARNFTSLWNPPPGNPAPGQNSNSADARRGAVIQMFYAVNRYHDELYRLGFTEQAGNFQANNFGRGGLGGDRISAEGQDFGGVNNANFSTPADGTRGRMQMYLWGAQEPRRDGTTDIEIMLHELTHGTSNRLHGNGFGLTTTMSSSLGEGWSDFYALSLLSSPADSLNGVHALGGYALFNVYSVGNRNYYYGIRRFPKATLTSVGGPNLRPHDPLTFADIDQTQLNTSDGAFPAMVGANISTAADQSHAGGEIWSAALWEIRGRFVGRLGWEIGNRRALQIVTDAMKISPLAPTFISARDAVVSAAIAHGSAEDVSDVWAGFAARGLGSAASIQTLSSGLGGARVTESFDLPNLSQSPAITISDATGNNNGHAEPGETVQITIPVTNNTGRSANNTFVFLDHVESISYGNIAHGQTVSQTFSYQIPQNIPCGGVLPLLIEMSSTLGKTAVTRKVTLGALSSTFSENFDNSQNFPAGWWLNVVNGGINFNISAASAHSQPNSAFAVNPSSVGGSAELTSPPIAISSTGSIVEFYHSYDTEAGWDGAVFEVSINGGGMQDILAIGGEFLEGGYDSTLGQAPTNPLANRRAWSGRSNGFKRTRILLPPSLAGQQASLRWRFGADNNTAATGWFVDSIKVETAHSCSPTAGSSKTRADFDGDGKTDLSVFRPENRVWYIDRSAKGFTAYQFGLSSDQIIPGDYDGDGKTDIAIFRPTNESGAMDVYILNSSDFSFSFYSWGNAGDIPVFADYSGDGRTDLGVFRPAENIWYIFNTDDGEFEFASIGQTGDIPVSGDFDGDGRTDLTFYRNGLWTSRLTSGGTMNVNFGLAGDKIVPADYDGDGRDDIAVFRDGVWYILKSSTNEVEYIFYGLANDVPVPGDYDGDGKYDAAIYRNGDWFIYGSTIGIRYARFGLAGDIPIPKGYIP